MPIQCQICKIEFQKLITSTHLKSHNTCSAEYKNNYGRQSLSSDEHRSNLSARTSGNNNPNFGKKHSEQAKRQISEKKQKQIPWNKGLKFEDTHIQAAAVAKRENRYKLGELIRTITPPTAQTKKKIAKSVKLYGVTHHDELADRAKKAIQTKRNNGYDLAVFRGKKHTNASLKKMSSAAKKNNIESTRKSQERIAALIKNDNLLLVSAGTDHFLRVQCITCGTEFEHTRQMFSLSKFHSNMCMKCFPPNSNRSRKEIELYTFILSLCPDAISNYKFNTSKKEIDIFIQTLNIGIEFNGLYWHSELVLSSLGVSPKKDNTKYNEILDAGIRCLVILEDEWDNKQEIVKSRLTHILGGISKKIYARQCITKEISSKIASTFCKQHHIQGAGRSNYRVGLYEKNKEQLLAVMTFSKNNISRKIHEWELNRFCSIPEYVIVGGASKLLSAFERAIMPKSIVTYADRRWSQGNVYSQLGFSYVTTTSPGYWYFRANECIRFHRYSLRKTKHDDQILSEWENRILQGWNRIWDCGNKKYIKTYI